MLTRMTDGRWLLEINGHAIPITDQQVDLLTEEVPFRMQVETVVATPSGVGLQLASVGDDVPVLHLCYSDEAEEFAAMILAASGFDHETGQTRTPAEREALLEQINAGGRHTLREAG